jgi:hypothetical protein
MAGACAKEVKGKPNAAADKREMRSLFMDANVLKVNKVIVASVLWPILTRHIHCQVRGRGAAPLATQFEIAHRLARFA